MTDVTTDGIHELGLGFELSDVWACTPTALNMAATVETASSPFKTFLFCMFRSPDCCYG